MKVCFIAEGCYPYVVGGVSSWIHSMIKSFPEIDFSIIAVIADRSQSKKFVYDLPANLKEVYEVYLNDSDWADNRKGQSNERFSFFHLSKRKRKALEGLLLNKNIDWATIFEMFENEKISVNELLMSPSFLHAVEESYSKEYQSTSFTDFLWTLRSIYAPMFLSLQINPPKADVYHCVATGYSGIIGSMAKLRNPGSRLVISEHGIYTREREEELIKAKWVLGAYKDIWIEQFYKMSQCAYDYADVVTSLYEYAKKLQIEFGCPAEKAVVTPNGINIKRLHGIAQKSEDDENINVGAIIRVTPIKDVKTMINAFHLARQKNPKLKLYIMGSDEEDKAYGDECHRLVMELNEDGIEFCGSVDIANYLGKMDFLLLTSLSEGQPLTILEGYAAKKPTIATNVGNCYGLIYGEEEDELGDAGIVVPVMNVQEISSAILELAGDEEKRKAMGEVGYKRLKNKYLIRMMVDKYEDIYYELDRKSYGRNRDSVKSNI